MSGAPAWFWDHVDEAYLRLELLRYRRVMRWAAVPIGVAVGTLLLPPIIAELFHALSGPQLPSPNQYASGSLTAMLLAVTLTMTAVAASRGMRIWGGEHNGGSLPHLLLTAQRPGALIHATWLSCVLLAAALTAVPVLAAAIVGVGTRSLTPAAVMAFGLAALCAMTAAAVGNGSFFMTRALTPVWVLRLIGGLAAALLVGAWLGITYLTGDWRASWDGHITRLAPAAFALTPIPYLIGLSTPEWWMAAVVRPLRFPVSPVAATAIYGAILALTMVGSLLLARRALTRLRAQPDLLDWQRPVAATDEGGAEFYWRGFANPVWTRDLRTRLRSKEVVQFIYVASIAVAAGGFIPLFTTARDLSNPLLIANVAREVFSWLTMTLVVFVALLTPSLSAEAVGREREAGTLDLLLSTPIRPREVLFGKLMGALSVMALLITPSLPLFGLCMLYHGAQLSQVVTAYLVIVATLVVTGLLGVTASATNARMYSAKWQAYGLSVLAVGLPGGLGWLAYGVVNAGSGGPQFEMMAWSALQLFFCAFILLLLWGNAVEQLEYAEY